MCQIVAKNLHETNETKLNKSCFVRWPIGIIYDFFPEFSFAQLFFIVFLFTQNFFFVSADFFSVSPFMQNYFSISVEFLIVFPFTQNCFSFTQTFFAYSNFFCLFNLFSAYSNCFFCFFNLFSIGFFQTFCFNFFKLFSMLVDIL